MSRRVAALTCLAGWVAQCTALAVGSMSPQSSRVADCVIVGGGFGGLYTALSLAGSCRGVRIQLVEARDRFCFQPLLYEYAMGLVEEAEMSALYEDLLPPEVELCPSIATKIDATEKSVTLQDGRVLEGKSLVIAVGCEPVRKPPALSFTTLEDAKALRAVDWKSVLIVGGGFTGVELACHLATRMKVTLVHRGAELLPSTNVATKNTARDALAKAGVDVRLSSKASSKDAVFYVDDAPFGSDATIWTAGTNTPALVSDMSRVHKAPDGRLRVSAALGLRGADGVFALGDNARVAGVTQPSSAQSTLQQAYVAASNIRAYLKQDSNIKTYNYVDLGSLLTLGEDDAAAQLLPFLLGDQLNVDGPVAALARRFVYAARMPTSNQRLNALAGLAQRATAARKSRIGSR